MSTPQLTQNRGRQTKVALKVTMAVTGLIFVCFVLFHMYGNLKLFMGEEAFNHYAEFLQKDLLYPILPKTGGVWLLRAVLGLALVLHVVAALVTWKRGKAARGPVQYKVKKGVKKQYTYGGTATMRYGGIFIFLFVAFHLSQFTIAKFNVGALDIDSKHDPYGLVVSSFQVWWVYLIYLLAMIFLALHVNHGVFSALATLGLERTGREKGFRVLALVCALALLIGFMLPPTAILFGLIS